MEIILDRLKMGHREKKEEFKREKEHNQTIPFDYLI